ncbi:hypothetical protein KEM55_001757, partial [Ascosphaera atra]
LQLLPLYIWDIWWRGRGQGQTQRRRRRRGERVNIYDRKPWQLAAAVEGDGADDAQNGVPRAPKPARVLDQLTTPTSHLVFSNDGQLLVMASRWKKDALRLVHLPSCTVYRNWPTSSTPFGRISAVAISPTSDMIAVANEAGKIRLWNVQG